MSFFPIFDMAKDLSGSVGHPIGDTTMNVSIHEDNSDMLVLESCSDLFTSKKNYSNVSWK